MDQQQHNTELAVLKNMLGTVQKDINEQKSSLFHITKLLGQIDQARLLNEHRFNDISKQLTELDERTEQLERQSYMAGGILKLLGFFSAGICGAIVWLFTTVNETHNATVNSTAAITEIQRRIEK